MGAGGVAKLASVPVGLEPVSVAIRNAGEVWVVNHLSDSVSIVDVSATPPRVMRTLLVGDEPRGHRVRRAGRESRLHHDRAPRAAADGRLDLRRDWRGRPAAHHGGRRVARTSGCSTRRTSATTVGGTPLKIVTLFADTPRALAVSPNGGTVYAAAFHSGNQTTTVSRRRRLQRLRQRGPRRATASSRRRPRGRPPGGNPGPSTNFAGVTAPEVGLIVKWNAAASQWQDELGRNWNNGVRFTPARQGRVRDRRDHARTRPASGPASARSSSTWS